MKLTTEQKRILLEFVEGNDAIAKNRLNIKFTAEDSKAMWMDITEKLNACNGPKKNWKGWRKSWSDIKTFTKAKAAAYMKEGRKSGIGSPKEPEPNSFHKRVIALIGHNAISGHSDIQESPIIGAYEETPMQVSITTDSQTNVQMPNNPGSSNTIAEPYLQPLPSTSFTQHRKHPLPPTSASHSHSQPTPPSSLMQSSFESEFRISASIPNLQPIPCTSTTNFHAHTMPSSSVIENKACSIPSLQPILQPAPTTVNPTGQQMTSDTQNVNRGTISHTSTRKKTGQTSQEMRVKERDESFLEMQQKVLKLKEKKIMILERNLEAKEAMRKEMMKIEKEKLKIKKRKLNELILIRKCLQKNNRT
ncbi:uncharacterized protein LOC124155353 isoform X2 [Ischnura elegans]|uniref:uncharacterized protein LOC124155353 isoform X2 n=1 Tax=Ischnura elegans TaxID=197161 RepID=UPI001ED89CA3|nr:uncharacterized protein LOC124155353 isoform X2 [Ischnura elegans]